MAVLGVCALRRVATLSVLSVTLSVPTETLSVSTNILSYPVLDSSFGSTAGPVVTRDLVAASRAVSPRLPAWKFLLGDSASSHSPTSIAAQSEVQVHFQSDSQPCEAAARPSRAGLCTLVLLDD